MFHLEDFFGPHCGRAVNIRFSPGTVEVCPILAPGASLERAEEGEAN